MLEVPADWGFLPAGDAGLTRRVKAAGPSWVVQTKRGRKTFSLGVWVPQINIDTERSRLESERASPAYGRKLEADRKRRERQQTEYVEDFRSAIVEFLAFAPCHALIGGRLADAVTVHTTPVGSGTVARTKRIPIERRAEAAVIAWLRHQTTGYDQMSIARVKGQRREVRRLLAARSKQLLAKYRAGLAVDAGCPLAKALGE